MSQEITIAGIGIAPEVLAAIVSRSVEQVEGVASVGVKDLATNLVSMFSAKSTQVGEDVEAEVIENIASRIADGEPGILGVMMESFLKGGHQKPAPLDQLVYGQSVTDSCVPWERTEELLHTLADAIDARRAL